MDWLENNAYWIAITVTVLVALVTAWRHLGLRASEQRQERFQNYHMLMRELVSGYPDGHAVMIDSQIAVVFELKNYPEYRDVSIRILEGLQQKWEKGKEDKPELRRLLEEISITLQELRQRSSWRLFRRAIQVPSAGDSHTTNSRSSNPGDTEYGEIRQLLVRISEAVEKQPQIRGHSPFAPFFTAAGLAAISIGLAMVTYWGQQEEPAGYTIVGWIFLIAAGGLFVRYGLISYLPRTSFSFREFRAQIGWQYVLARVDLVFGLVFLIACVAFLLV